MNNMEKNTDSISWLHGLEDYFRFKQSTDIANACANFLKVMYSENKAHTLRNVMMEAIPTNPNEKDIHNVLNFYSHSANLSNNMKLDEISAALSSLYPNEGIFKIINKYYREQNEPSALEDTFSRGQINSKIWLVTELAKVKKDFDTVFFLAGWFGQLRHFIDLANVTYNKIRVLDINPIACKVSDQIFNVDKIENYLVKSVEVDLNDMSWLFRTGCDYNLKNYTTNATINEKTIPDLIINTSAEHFHERWYHKFVNRPLETDPLFVIQSNNLHEVTDHINSIHSLEEMQIKFPMTRLLYAGELQLSGYKRYMLIGRP
jgi:hypothetical protein